MGRNPLILIATLTAVVVGGHASAQPAYEMRAVWLTTAIGLDWPAGVSGAAAQEASLRSKIRAAADRNLNTVFFQVVPRGDAFYQSERLPWSSLLTGTAGADPGFDPLAVAVDEAHTNGMELHAWYNVYRVQPTQTPGAGPDHVTETHPEWTEKDGQWLNPGYPGVDDWVVDNLVEIVENYDVDGIHLDFARYDLGGYIRDDSLFATNNPNGIATKDDWRRENVTRLVQKTFAAVTDAKRWIKVGSTPIGIYDTTCINTEFTGYEGVFQESRRWLQEGINDYLTPQIYWADTYAPRPGLYSCLVDDWMSEKGPTGNLYVGIALYEPDVKAEIGSQIDIARTDGAQGEAFFREEHTHGEDFAGRFDLPALWPATAFRFEASAPTTPHSLGLFVDPTARVVQLSWQKSTGTASDPVGWYLVLRSSDGFPDLDDPAEYRALVYAEHNAFLDTLAADETGPFTYAVVAFGRLGLESDVSETLTTDEIPTSIETPESPDFSVGFAYPNPARNRVRLSIDDLGAASFRIRVIDQNGRVVSRQVIGSAHRNPVVVETGNLAAGLYTIEVVSNGRRAIRMFVLVR